jgi:hypothetical protein
MAPTGVVSVSPVTRQATSASQNDSATAKNVNVALPSAGEADVPCRRRIEVHLLSCSWKMV